MTLADTDEEQPSHPPDANPRRRRQKICLHHPTGRRMEGGRGHPAPETWLPRAELRHGRLEQDRGGQANDHAGLYVNVVGVVVCKS
jgi:hypothetical protein